MSQDKVSGHHKPWKEQQGFWNSTITTLSHGARDLWKNPRITMIRIEVLVSLVAGVLIFLAIFGSRRRRSRNWFLQKGVFGAFTLSFSLATYILGSMQSSAVKSSMYPIWAISLMMLHGCTDSITAYSIDDIKQRARLAYEAYMYAAYALLLLISVQTVYTLPLVFMAFIAFIRYAQRIAACSLAGYSWNMNKIVADYMYEEQNKGVFATMEDCSYLVEWPIHESKFDAPTYAAKLTADPEKDEVIDIGKVWRCKEISLVLKDACLSFSLFHLLRSRCFGFACDEYKDSAHSFLVLLVDNEGYHRLFRVIEVELAFMYDFFFTKYGVIYYGPIAATILSLISAIGMSLMSYITARAPVEISHGDSVVVSTIRDDIIITVVILASTGLLEFLQLLLYWTGIWGRVSFVCQSIREKGRSNRRKAATGSCLIMGLKKFLANIGMSCARNKHYWQHGLGQYSLLDSVEYNPSPSLPGKILNLLIHHLIGTILRMVYATNHQFLHPRNSQVLKVRNKGWGFVELPYEVEKAVICSLQRNGGTLSNGRSSLRSIRAHHLLWSCEWDMHPDQGWSQRNQNQTHVILTWHIATCFCEMLTLNKYSAARLSSPPYPAFSVATKLSKYCAYLVVCAPMLLPGHLYDTVQKFDATAMEAIELRKRATAWDDMTWLEVPQERDTIFGRGVMLGKQLLEGMDEHAPWKVMADFWAEMILYLAPSDNALAHIGYLAQGGEFITHLWALLSHAGIIKREPEHQAGGV